MKINVLLQFLLIVVLVFFIKLGFDKFNDFQQKQFSAFETNKMVISSQNEEILKNIEMISDSLSFIKEVEFHSAQKRKNEAMERFKDEIPENLLKKIKVNPRIIISFKAPQVFNTELKQFFNDFGITEEDNIFFNFEMYQKFSKMYFIYQRLKIFLLPFLTFILFLIFLRLRVKYTGKENHYWKIIKRSGGNYHNRNRIFYREVFILILGAIVSYFGYLYYSQQLQLTKNNIYELTMIVGFIIFYNLITKIILRKQVW